MGQQPGTKTAVVNNAQQQLTTGTVQQEKAVTEPSFLDTHQTLAVGLLAFVIGLLTVFNAMAGNILAERARKKEVRRKRLAYFAATEADIEALIESIRRTQEVVASVDASDGADGGWVRSLRVASRLGDFRPLQEDWEKLAVLGVDNIKAIRVLNQKLNEVRGLFDSILTDPEAARAQTPLPLFERRLEEADKADDRERVNVLVEDLQDAIQDCLDTALAFRNRVRRELGEKHGVDTQA